MLLSGGILVKEAVVWSGTPATWPGWDQLQLGSSWASYGEIYKRQLWVAVLVNKRARATARLPLKVYERNVDGREEARDHPYARLLRRPNEKHSRNLLWLWLMSTWDIYGEVFLAKQRDRGGRPIALLPLHPTAMHPEDERDGQVLWTFRTGKVQVDKIPTSDLVHVRTYNPDNMIRGLSPLEPLRRTLEFEDAAQRSQSSFWRKGARPGLALTHPKTISKPAADRLKVQWDQIAAGADNTGTTVVLEEGMKPEVLTISAEEAQYIESRKLNREEACAAYDMPPPAVHILDRATFNNITEQFRSVYRDTMAPVLGAWEEELEFQLRGAIQPGRDGPDFGDDVYSEFLLDEVLRGDFEKRAEATQKAINSAQMTPNEARQLENRPPLPGGDQLYINSTMVPLDLADDVTAGAAARWLTSEETRTLMGRLSRQKQLDEVDPSALVAGLNGASDLVLGELEAAKAAGLDVAGFRQRLRGRQ
jgi:HK97 family phage portal protein